MSQTAGVALARLHQGFFDEARENLGRVEQLLLGIDPAQADDECLNAVFRCAHSLKGGAATFGFDELAELTHRMETLLDRLRRHELVPTAPMIDLLLEGVDALKAMLARSQGQAEAAPDSRSLCQRLGAWAGPAQAAPPPSRAGTRRLELQVGPLHDEPALRSLVALFDEIVDLGCIAPLDAGVNHDGVRRFELVTDCSDTELIDLFSFHVDAAKLRLTPLGPVPGAPTPARPAAPARDAEAATLRVAVERIDQLLNQVGELVVAQSTLALAIGALDPAAQQQLAGAAAELQRHTRQLQDSVMAVRMVPVATVFARFPRLLRDLAAGLGKQVELVLSGEATELDRGMIEKITDPLTHLVRNACDHGIELPAERRACGKPETGQIRLAASHQGASVVIEVSDDGAGLSRERLLAKARQLGLPASESFSDAQVWALVFAPGLSTATAVTELSGRGVGMDVVQRNIAALGGTVQIDSQARRGTSVRVRVPLTLAIMEAMTVCVADECYILPLAAVVETCRGGQAPPQHLAGAQWLSWRDAVLPVLDLQRLFAVPPAQAGPRLPLLVVVEAEGRRIALRVDEVLGQQPVVVKNLEAHYGRVDGISGATILGDGRVALILDVGALVRRTRP